MSSSTAGICWSLLSADHQLLYQAICLVLIITKTTKIISSKRVNHWQWNAKTHYIPQFFFIDDGKGNLLCNLVCMLAK